MPEICFKIPQEQQVRGGRDEATDENGRYGCVIGLQGFIIAIFSLVCFEFFFSGLENKHSLSL